MDEEHTSDYRQPCAQCSEVDWGITDEGRFYCRSCHDVIERTQDVVDASCLANSRISSISRGTKNKRKLVLSVIPDHGREWVVCEGFQFILKHQAEALLAMGVCPQFKDDVLCNMWRKYLQKSRQGYTRNPIHAGKFRVSLASDSESAPESVGLSEVSLLSGSEADGERASRPSSASGYSSDGASSVCSGSQDGEIYYSAKNRKSLTLMSMPMTLALCHLALLWLREAVTLADLLRFVAEGHVPYVNAHQCFPEDMQLYGTDLKVFRVESIPSYKSIQLEAQKLAVFLGLPTFPPITLDCLLHPSLLCLKYLMEANLPDELHGWVSKVIEQTRTGEEALLTYDPTARRFKIPSYEVQAAALIIVTMKLLFKLDDKVEWKLSNKADEKNSKNQAVKTFCLRRWYETVHCALDLAREREEQDHARQTWKPKKALYPSKKDKTVVIKRRRVVEQLQMTFQKLSGSTVEPQRSAPSSFRFQWGEEGTDGPSFHNHRLGCVLKKKSSSPQLSNLKYWHTALKVCDSWHDGTHFQEVEPTLPRTYMWLLGLFSFLLGVKAARVHAEVCHVERRLIKGTPFTGHKTVSPRRKNKETAKRSLKRKKVSLTKTSTV